MHWDHTSFLGRLVVRDKLLQNFNLLCKAGMRCLGIFEALVRAAQGLLQSSTNLLQRSLDLLSCASGYA